jgi:hypothetical protein
MHVTDAICDFQGLLIEGDRLVYLSLSGIDSCHLMQCGGFALHVADAFFDIYGLLIEGDRLVYLSLLGIVKR